MSEPGGVLSARGAGWHRAEAIGLGLAGFILFVALWWVSLQLFVPPASFLSRFSPEATLASLVNLLGTAQIWPHLVASLRRVLIGLAISAAIGFPLGLIVGGLSTFARMSGPVFQFIRMVSPLSWTPLAIILLGVGDAPVYFLIAAAGVWPIALNTSAGVAALDPRWITVGRSLGGSRWEIGRSIVWPAIRPHVLTGLRLSVGLAWIILVPAEMLGVDSGLGYFILDTRDRLAYSELLAAIIVIGLCGFLIDSAARSCLSERQRPSRAGAASRSPQAVAVAGTTPDVLKAPARSG